MILQQCFSAKPLKVCETKFVTFHSLRSTYCTDVVTRFYIFVVVIITIITYALSIDISIPIKQKLITRYLGTPVS